MREDWVASQVRELGCPFGVSELLVCIAESILFYYPQHPPSPFPIPVIAGEGAPTAGRAQQGLPGWKQPSHPSLPWGRRAFYVRAL